METTCETTEALVENHRRFLAFVRKRVGCDEDAKEVLQAAFVKSLEKGGTLANPESVVPWFYRLLRNAIVDHYRRKGARERALEREGHEYTRAEYASELEAAVCECVERLLPTLKLEYADILRSVDLGEEDISTAATRLNTSPNNIRVRLHRARRALRKQLALSCGSCAEHGCLRCECGD